MQVQTAEAKGDFLSVFNMPVDDRLYVHSGAEYTTPLITEAVLLERENLGTLSPRSLFLICDEQM